MSARCTEYCPTAARASEQPTAESTARRAAQLLADTPERDWRLRDLAGEVHLSVSQLGRVFTRAFGCTPMQYLTHVRAHRLAHLLVETELPVGTAMQLVGWRSRGHAARQFTDIVGVQPSVFRRECTD